MELIIIIALIIVVLTLIFITNCTLDKVINHHGVHNLEKKQVKLKVDNFSFDRISLQK